VNREDIIRMAREAGLVGLEQGGVLENFERFAALAAEWGAKQEREACAKVAETHQYVAGWGVAAAIRARGEVKP
jgi:hypothetical protein